MTSSFGPKVDVFSVSLSFCLGLHQMVIAEVTPAYLISQRNQVQKHVYFLSQLLVVSELGSWMFLDPQRTRLKFSWETHYVGDVRAVNCGPIDTYQLKSLDGQLEGDMTVASLTKHKGRIYIDANLHAQKQNKSEDTPRSKVEKTGYDVVIRALGFKYDRSIFEKSIRPSLSRAHKKYPEIKPNYEFTSTPNIYVAGTAVHSLDFRKSAGGFIHGFRYTTRTLARYLEWKNHGVVWPHVTLHVTELMNYLIQRINEASDIYQMFSQLCDVIVFRDTETVEYYQALGIGMLPEFEQHTGKSFPRGIVLNMEYGKNFSGPGSDPFRESRATGYPQQGHTSNFLHPVLYYYTKMIPALRRKGILPRPHRIHHMVEDFLTEWNLATTHTLPLRWFLEYCIGSDLRKYTAQNCMKYAMTGSNIPAFCQHGYLNGAAFMSC